MSRSLWSRHRAKAAAMYVSRRLPLWLVFAGGVCGAAAPIAAAPPTARDADQQVVQAGDGILPRPGRESQRGLSVARRAIQQQRYSEAAAELHRLLEPEIEDGFVASGEGEAAQTTLRREACRLLGAMPAPGRRAYRLQCGAEAQWRLDQAIRDGDRSELARISSECFHTAASYEATMLLAYDHLDHARPLEAIGWLRRIDESPVAADHCEPECSLLLATCWLWAGNPNRARDALERLKQRVPAARFRIGQRECSAADAAEVLALLSKAAGPQRQARGEAAGGWPMFRGNTARNAQAAWTPPLGERRWTADLLEDPADVESVRTAEQSSLGRGVPPLPSLHPLALGDTLLARTPWRLVAVDFRTGRQVWEYPWGTSSASRTRTDGPPGRSATGSQQRSELSQRVWDDAACGQLSSDAQRVYLLERVDAADNRLRRTVWAGGGMIRVVGPETEDLSNRLVALSLAKEGAMAWSVGGANGEDEPRLAGAFFLGAPLPDRQQLYVLAEVKGEILLCALEADTGRLQWSQVVARPTATISQDLVRRLAGASPSLSDGLVICPTSAGAAVAVDPATHSLVWGYPYPRSEPPANARLRWLARLPSTQPGAPSRWIDASAILAEGRVLLTPVDSDQIFCLDLFTGRELWSRVRGELLFAACVHEGNVILVGAREVTALRLADRKPAWKPASLALPSQAIPTGRGLHCGRFYYLPTTDKRLLQIALSDGRITAEIQTGEPLGNLIAHRGHLISQSAESLQQFAPGCPSPNAYPKTNRSTAILAVPIDRLEACATRFAIRP